MNISQFRIILDFQYQGCVRSTVSGVFGNLKFNFRRLHKIEAKQRQQTGQRHENFNFDPSLLKFQTESPQIPMKFEATRQCELKFGETPSKYKFYID